MAEHPLFAMIDAVERASPFNPVTVTGATQMPLRGVADESDEDSTTFAAVGVPGSPLASLELRVPRQPADGTVGLLILTLSPQVQLTPADVIGRYGGNTGLDVPTPRQPPDSPVYYEYDRPWGKLSFGFSRTEPERLTNVVLDGYR